MFSFFVFLFGFVKWSGFVSINVILCCICVFTLVEEKIHLCLWEFSGALGEEIKPIIWAWMLGLGGKKWTKLGCWVIWGWWGVVRA